MSACMAAHFPLRGDVGIQNASETICVIVYRPRTAKNHSTLHSRSKVHCKPGKRCFVRFYHAVGQRASPNTGKPQNVLLRVTSSSHGTWQSSMVITDIRRPSSSTTEAGMR